MAGEVADSTLTVDTIREVNEYLYIMEDTPEFIAGRIRAAETGMRKAFIPRFSCTGQVLEDFEYSLAYAGTCRGTAFVSLLRTSVLSILW